MAPFSKNVDFNSKRDHPKNFLWALRLWVGRREEPILGYVPKNDEKKNSEGKGLSWQEHCLCMSTNNQTKNKLSKIKLICMQGKQQGLLLKLKYRKKKETWFRPCHKCRIYDGKKPFSVVLNCTMCLRWGCFFYYTFKLFLYVVWNNMYWHIWINVTSML